MAKCEQCKKRPECNTFEQAKRTDTVGSIIRESIRMYGCEDFEEITQEDELGVWKPLNNMTVICSYCGVYSPDIRPYIAMNFCPVCGTRMRRQSEGGETDD